MSGKYNLKEQQKQIKSFFQLDDVVFLLSATELTHIDSRIKIFDLESIDRAAWWTNFGILVYDLRYKHPFGNGGEEKRQFYMNILLNTNPNFTPLFYPKDKEWQALFGEAFNELTGYIESGIKLAPSLEREKAVEKAKELYDALPARAQTPVVASESIQSQKKRILKETAQYMVAFRQNGWNDLVDIIGFRAFDQNHGQKKQVDWNRLYSDKQKEKIYLASLENANRELKADLNRVTLLYEELKAGVEGKLGDLEKGFNAELRRLAEDYTQRIEQIRFEAQIDVQTAKASEEEMRKKVDGDIHRLAGEIEKYILEHLSYGKDAAALSKAFVEHKVLRSLVDSYEMVLNNTHEFRAMRDILGNFYAGSNFAVIGANGTSQEWVQEIRRYTGSENTRTYTGTNGERINENTLDLFDVVIVLADKVDPDYFSEMKFGEYVMARWVSHEKKQRLMITVESNDAVCNVLKALVTKAYHER